MSSPKKAAAAKRKATKKNAAVKKKKSPGKGKKKPKGHALAKNSHDKKARFRAFKACYKNAKYFKLVAHDCKDAEPCGQFKIVCNCNVSGCTARNKNYWTKASTKFDKPKAHMENHKDTITELEKNKHKPLVQQIQRKSGNTHRQGLRVVFLVAFVLAMSMCACSMLPRIMQLMHFLSVVPGLWYTGNGSRRVKETIRV